MYNKCLFTFVSRMHLSVSACKKQVRKPWLAGLGGFMESCCEQSQHMFCSITVVLQLPSPLGCVVLRWGAHDCCDAAFHTPNPIQNPGSVPMIGITCPKHQFTAFAALLDAKDCHRPVLICPKLVKCVRFTQCSSGHSLFWSISGRFLCFSAVGCSAELRAGAGDQQICWVDLLWGAPQDWHQCLCNVLREAG